METVDEDIEEGVDQGSNEGLEMEDLEEDDYGEGVDQEGIEVVLAMRMLRLFWLILVTSGNRYKIIVSHN